MPVMNGAVESKSFVSWQSIIPSVTSVGNLPDYPAINLIDPATWNSWRPSVPNGRAEFDFGTVIDVDTLGIAGHNMATSAAGLSIQSSPDNINWTNRGNIYPLTDDDFTYLFSSTFSFRYWRIIMLDNTANISVAVISKRLTFPHTPIDSYTPLHHARRYEKMFNDSINGVMLGNRVMAAGAETDVDFGFVQRDFVDGPLRAFESHYNQGGTFFYAGWPAGQPLDMGYCRASTEDEIINVEYVHGEGLANLSMGLKSYVG